MGCKHRFYGELGNVTSDLEFLFIGTFNPEWQSKNNNNSDFFYGRDTNLFWCIVPHAFDENCLIDKGKAEWVQFCEQPDHRIGLTDLIKEVVNAEISLHSEVLANRFSDEDLDRNLNGVYRFELDFNTDDILEIVNKYRLTLKGVFFTRSSFQGIARIWNEWRKIKTHCEALSQEGSKITCWELPTPSSKGRSTGVRRKIEIYKKAITSSRQNATSTH